MGGVCIAHLCCIDIYGAACTHAKTIGTLLVTMNAISALVCVRTVNNSNGITVHNDRTIYTATQDYIHVPSFHFLPSEMHSPSYLATHPFNHRRVHPSVRSLLRPFSSPAY